MAIHLADLFEHAVDAVGDRDALRVGDRVLTFAEVEAEANRLAHFLAGRGVGPGDHVGVYAKNSIEHVVSLLAIFKLRTAAVNVNYRYLEPELSYLFDNADLVGLLFERPYAPLVAACAPKVPGLHTLVALPDVLDPDNDADLTGFGGLTWEEAVAGQSADRDFGERSADDLYLVYTGGTTGQPKGVMWRQEDFWRVLCGGIDFHTGEEQTEFSQSEAARAGTKITFPLSPVMHGGAQSGLLMHLFRGELTILEPRFDPVRTWEIIRDHGVQVIFLTGDAMARPLIEAYESGDYQITSLVAVASGAAIFSAPVKERWLAAFPQVIFTDSIGSSETGFQGTGLQQSDTVRGEGALFTLGRESVLLDDDDKPLDPATAPVGQVGRLARSGSIPLGYYKDPDKTERTFPTIDGVRYAVPGDLARVEPDGKLLFLGRGSNCINTGGEKVFPEEVEAALKKHPGVYDALVLGIADETFGQSVAAVLQPRPGHRPTLAELRDFLRTELAGYKLPRTVELVEEIPRQVTGKADYVRARALLTPA